MPEMFSKSRAQEMQMAITNLRNDIQEKTVRLDKMQKELRARCPHPDDHVVKLDEYRQNKLFKPKALYLCKICGLTQTKGVS